eukprot:gene11811-8122_t
MLYFSLVLCTTQANQMMRELSLSLSPLDVIQEETTTTTTTKAQLFNKMTDRYNNEPRTASATPRTPGIAGTTGSYPTPMRWWECTEPFVTLKAFLEEPTTLRNIQLEEKQHRRPESSQLASLLPAREATAATPNDSLLFSSSYFFGCFSFLSAISPLAAQKRRQRVEDCLPLSCLGYLLLFCSRPKKIRSHHTAIGLPSNLLCRILFKIYYYPHICRASLLEERFSSVSLNHHTSAKRLIIIIIIIITDISYLVAQDVLTSSCLYISFAPSPYLLQPQLQPSYIPDTRCSGSQSHFIFFLFLFFLIVSSPPAFSLERTAMMMTLSPEWLDSLRNAGFCLDDQERRKYIKTVESLGHGSFGKVREAYCVPIMRGDEEMGADPRTNTSTSTTSDTDSSGSVGSTRGQGAYMRVAIKEIDLAKIKDEAKRLRVVSRAIREARLLRRPRANAPGSPVVYGRDVWAVGCMLFIMAHDGAVPFDADDSRDLRRRIAGRRLSVGAPAAGRIEMEVLHQLALRCLEVDTTRRPTVSQVLQELNAKLELLRLSPLNRELLVPLGQMMELEQHPGYGQRTLKLYQLMRLCRPGYTLKVLSCIPSGRSRCAAMPVSVVGEVHAGAYVLVDRQFDFPALSAGESAGAAGVGEDVYLGKPERWAKIVFPVRGFCCARVNGHHVFHPQQYEAVGCPLLKDVSKTPCRRSLPCAGAAQPGDVSEAASVRLLSREAGRLAMDTAQAACDGGERSVWDARCTCTNSSSTAFTTDGERTTLFHLVYTPYSSTPPPLAPLLRGLDLFCVFPHPKEMIWGIRGGVDAQRPRQKLFPLTIGRSRLVDLTRFEQLSLSFFFFCLFDSSNPFYLSSLFVYYYYYYFVSYFWLCKKYGGGCRKKTHAVLPRYVAAAVAEKKK